MKHPLFSLPRFFDVSKKKSHQRQSSDLPEGICREFSLAEIKAATNNFHRDLFVGESEFGQVYKGTIDDGTRVVAIKRSQSRSVFRTEVQMLCQLHHPNLISLIGFCHEKDDMIIVSEFLSRGSLYDQVRGRNGFALNWKQRLEICIGAARGLHYLHTGAKHVVFHRNIKSSNILLDNEWSCKLSDFRLSIVGPLSMSKTTIKKIDSRIQGTIAYMAPELRLHGEVTDRCDVYSFGVVLFEVLCGRKVFDRALPQNQQDLFEWVSELGRDGKVYHAVDPYLKGKIAPECFRKYLEIARSCVHYEGNERPAMGEVEVSLELALELQEKADSVMQGIASHDEPLYEEASSCAYFDLYSHYYGNGNTNRCSLKPRLQTNGAPMYIKLKKKF